MELFDALPEHELEKRTTTDDYALGVEKLQYGPNMFTMHLSKENLQLNCDSISGHFAIGDYIKLEAIPHVRLMREKLWYVTTCGMTYKTCPYLRTINPVVDLVLQAGLLHHWEERVIIFLHASL